MRNLIWTLGMVAIIGACSSDEDTKPGTDGGGQVGDVGVAPQLYGAACEADEACKSKMCFRGHCSKLCKRLSDCEPVREDPDPSKPAGTAGGPCKEGECNVGLVCVNAKECLRAFECGRETEEEGSTRLLCGPRQYDIRKYTSGHDCSLDGVCAKSYRCMGQPSEADRYCSGTCTSDWECPPPLRCAKITTYEGSPEQRCMRRRIGHPCDFDDQCGGASRADQVCIKDTQGKHYCTKTCATQGRGTCPPFAKCEQVGNGVQACRYSKGYAYKVEGGLCDPCIYHGATDDKQLVEQSACIDGGACLQLSQYTQEASCLTPCGAGDTCPDDTYHCFDTTSLGKLCGPKREVPGGLTVGTCY